jgi:hypothetical protein
MIYKIESQGEDDEFINTVNIDTIDLVSLLEARSPISSDWTPIRVRRVHPTSNRRKPVKVDMPFYGTHVLFLRPRAVDALGTMLLKYGEILRVQDEGGDELYLYHAFNFVDALDIENSTIERFSTGRIMRIERHVFLPETVEGVDVFRIPQMRASPIFVSDLFADLVSRSGLTGTEFELVWPL